MPSLRLGRKWVRQGSHALNGTMSELFDYYWRVLRRAFGLAFSWNRDSFMNFIPVILVLLFEVNRGWLDAGKFAHEAGAQTLLVVLALMTYFIPALAWAPVALDRERAEKTEKLVARLGGEVSVTFKSLRFEHPVPDQRITRVRIDVAFRTSDVPATLGSWALRSEKAPAISPVCSHIWGFND